MILLNIRSPYFIEVNETAQLGSKVELFIWNNGTTEPVTATYILSKSIASTTQRNNVYNISNFVKSFIENTYPDDSSTDKMYVNVKVKRYKETTLNVYTLLDTVSYIAVNGYTKYVNGYNYDTVADTVVLANKNVKIQYTRTHIGYLNVISDVSFNAIYTDLAVGNTIIVVYSGSKFYKVPVSTSSAFYNNGNTLTINSDSFLVLPICEQKYTPVKCAFINRFGGWQIITFFKSQINSINISSTAYNVYSDVIDYSIYKGQTKVLNVNGKQNVKLNTGWVDENYSELIQDLLMSEKILLDNKPAIINTKSIDLKTSIKDRNINYELEFEYAYNLLNNVI